MGATIDLDHPHAYRNLIQSQLIASLISSDMRFAQPEFRSIWTEILSLVPLQALSSFIDDDGTNAQFYTLTSDYREKIRVLDSPTDFYKEHIAFVNKFLEKCLFILKEPNPGFTAHIGEELSEAEILAEEKINGSLRQLLLEQEQTLRTLAARNLNTFKTNIENLSTSALLKVSEGFVANLFNSIVLPAIMFGDTAKVSSAADLVKQLVERVHQLTSYSDQSNATPVTK